VIIVTGSNHRRRVENAIRQLPQSLLFLAEHNPEKYLAQPFERVHSLEEWWVQLGDCIYAHKEGHTANAGDNGRDAIDTSTSGCGRDSIRSLCFGPLSPVIPIVLAKAFTKASSGWSQARWRRSRWPTRGDRASSRSR
jgi:hypothetical protein